MPKYVKYIKPGSRGPYKKAPPNVTELRAFCRHLTSLGYGTSAKWLRSKLDIMTKTLERHKIKEQELRNELAKLREEYNDLLNLQD